MLGVPMWVDHHHLGFSAAGEPLRFHRARACPSPAPRRDAPPPARRRVAVCTPHHCSPLRRPASTGPSGFQGSPQQFAGGGFGRPNRSRQHGMARLRRQRPGQLLVGHQGGRPRPRPARPAGSFLELAPSTRAALGPQPAAASTGRCGLEAIPTRGTKQWPTAGWRLSVQRGPARLRGLGRSTPDPEHPRGFELTSRIAFVVSGGFEHDHACPHKGGFVPRLSAPLGPPSSSRRSQVSWIVRARVPPVCRRCSPAEAGEPFVERKLSPPRSGQACCDDQSLGVEIASRPSSGSIFRQMGARSAAAPIAQRLAVVVQWSARRLDLVGTRRVDEVDGLFRPDRRLSEGQHAALTAAVLPSVEPVSGWTRG